MRRLTAAVLTALFVMPFGAEAQTLPSVDDPEATVLADLVVVAPTEGPAWWRVSKGESVVWIMGLPASSTPKGLVWDHKALDRRMKGANALLVPPSGTLTLGKGEKVSVIKFLPGVRWTNGNVEEAMPPTLAARFARVRARIKKPVGRYASPIPATAFIRLYGDFHASAKLEPYAARGIVRATAKRLRVPVVQPPKVTMGELKLAEVDPSRPEAAACYDAFLDNMEVPVERYRTAAQGWARGDLKAAISGPREAFQICENRLFNQGASRRAIEAQVAAIEDALKRPGKTLAIANLRSLLADEGILDRLAEKGYDIVYPTSIDEEAD